MDLTLRDLRAVCFLAEDLHFTRTAERLGVAQPQLSATVARVEREAGVVLFVRRPRVTVTPAGDLFIQAARRALAEAADGMARAQAATRGEVGVLRVGFAPTFVLSDLARVFAVFRDRRPGVQLELREMHSARLWSAVSEDQVDVAFTREVRPDPTIQSEVVLRDPFVVALALDHLLAETATTPIAALAGEPFVLFRQSVAPSLHAQILAACADGGFIPRVAQEADEWSTILAFVRLGFGVTLVSRGLAALHFPGVAFRPLAGTREQATFSLCWKPQRLTPPAAAFIAMVRERSTPAS